MDIAANIRQYISQNLLFSEDGFHYSDDDSFLDQGIIDSEGVMELVVFVEQEFSIAVTDLEITPENFDSVNKLAKYIDEKIQKGSS
jgi:acyl carrier protein